MKVTKSIVFFIFVLITYTAIVVNYIVIKTATQINIEVLEELEEIHFSSESLSPEQSEEIINIVDSNSTNSYKALVTSKSPIKNFYGFCGYLKGNQKSTFKHFKFNPLLNNTPVNIVYKDNNIETTLSHALLILLTETPTWLSRPLSDDFIAESEEHIVKALNSLSTLGNQEHKRLLIKFSLTKYENIRRTTTENLLDTDLTTLSDEDKYFITFYIPYLDKESRELLLDSLLDESDESVLLSSIENISSESSEKVLGKLRDLMLNSSSKRVKIASIMKYGTILNKMSLPLIDQILNETFDYDEIKACITIIGLYGNSSYYETLRTYLGYRYGLDINIEALKAIVSTTYKASPESVINTMTFIIRNTSEHQLAKYAIQVHIDKGIKANGPLIILRLRQQDSIKLKEMKYLALDYIETFKPITSATISLLRRLTSDSDRQIKKRANKLLEEIIKLRDSSSASSAGTNSSASGTTGNSSGSDGDNTSDAG